MGPPRGRDILLLMSFFAELKRRSVFRVAIGYVGVSWLILQVVDVLFGIFDYETDIDETIVIVLAIGFIPAMLLAWAFELSSKGVRRENEPDGSAAATSGGLGPAAAGQGLCLVFDDQPCPFVT